jgi:hypothetical protein
VQALTGALGGGLDFLFEETFSHLSVDWNSTGALSMMLPLRLITSHLRPLDQILSKP